MNSPAPPFDVMPLARHRLVRLLPSAWAECFAARSELAAEPLLRDWAAHGWPLIVRRPTPGERGVALGLPLPPAAGKRRIALTVEPDRIERVEWLPQAADVADVAPSAWQPCLRELSALAQRYQVRCHVFGSLAWQRLTGLRYLSAGSDLDVLLTLPVRRESVAPLLAALAALDARAPMRIDGELVRADGAGVNWRELHEGACEVALKTATDVVLSSPAAFLGTMR